MHFLKSIDWRKIYNLKIAPMYLFLKLMITLLPSYKIIIIIINISMELIIFKKRFN